MDPLPLSPRERDAQELILAIMRQPAIRRIRQQTLEDLQELAQKICAAKERGCRIVFDGARAKYKQLPFLIAEHAEKWGSLPKAIYDTPSGLALGRSVRPS